MAALRFISGTVTNGGTLFAAGVGDLVEIASGAVVNGGLALIGNGIVDIAGSSGEGVRFLALRAPFAFLRRGHDPRALPNTRNWRQHGHHSD